MQCLWRLLGCVKDIDDPSSLNAIQMIYYTIHILHRVYVISVVKCFNKNYSLFYVIWLTIAKKLFVGLYVQLIDTRHSPIRGQTKHRQYCMSNAQVNARFPFSWCEGFASLNPKTLPSQKPVYEEGKYENAIPLEYRLNKKLIMSVWVVASL